MKHLSTYVRGAELNYIFEDDQCTNNNKVPSECLDDHMKRKML